MLGQKALKDAGEHRGQPGCHHERVRVRADSDRIVAAVSTLTCFFPERGESVKEAKAVCTGCPVRAECLEYALDNQEKFRIWGGLSERGRRQLRRQRRLREAT
jgi:WhiB family redox-sensing transcriptional regulator